MLLAAAAAECVGILVELDALEGATAEHFAQRGECNLDVIDVVTDRELRENLRGARLEDLRDRGANRAQLRDILHALGRAEHVRRERAARLR